MVQIKEGQEVYMVRLRQNLRIYLNEWMNGINGYNSSFKYYLLLYLRYRKLICNIKLIKNIEIFYD